MTDRAQFEAMLEALINEDQDLAKEIFHNIVVSKSREIYEELLAEDFSPEEANKHAGLTHESMEEEEEEESMEEGEEEESAGEEEEGEEEEEEEEGDDAEGEEDPFGGEDDGEADDGDLEDRVMDLEDALEDLKAEFEQLMADEEHEPEHHDGVDDPAFGGDEMGGDEMGGHDELDNLMEYVNKVGGNTYNTFGKMGDNGTNTKSVIDNMKNDMGGTTANIAQSHTETKGGTQGGLLKPSAGDLTAGLGEIQNRVNSKAGKTGFKTQVKDAHGAEKAGKKETADNKKSVIASRVR